MSGILAIGLAAGAAAAPVYLDCTLREGPNAISIDIAVDEANQNVTIALPSGRTVTRSALFSPAEVKVPDDPDTWIISRVDLKLRRLMSFMPAGDQGEAGTCRLKPVPAKRAF